MIDTIFVEPHWANIQAQQRRAAWYWRLWFVALLGITGATILFMLYVKPIPAPLGGVIFLGTVIAIAYRPRYGIYFIVFFSLVGDASLLPSYPFVKNFSSAESLLYIHSALIFSPLELYLVLILVLWLGKGAMRRQLHFTTGVLFGPALFFALCLVFGIVYGLGTGGDANVGLWEVRPIFYLLLGMFLTSNLLTKPEHFDHLFWAIMLALGIEGIVGCHYYFVVLGGNLTGVDMINEHSASIHMNTLFIYVMALWLYRGSRVKQVVLPLLMPAVMITYIAAQRRAAFLSLGIALVIMAILLYRENRRLFWIIVPMVGLVGTLYIGAFWNSQGALGLPAQAVRSVIAPQEGSEDEMSNLYRVLENINVSFTIHAAPLTGVGFGQKFYIVRPMPDISFFVWWEYITHNSILWIWMKTGAVGFIAMVFLVGFSIMTGARAVMRLEDGNLRAMALTGALYIVMHFLYAYVDMSWDTQSMLYLGVTMGMLNCIESVAAQPVKDPQPQLAQVAAAHIWGQRIARQPVAEAI
ncbi:MAG: O-antigen ligase family protein [Caldilineaceae bacterium]